MRKCKDWLWSYVEYNSNQESPSIFHLWVGFSLLAAALGRRVWLDKAYYKLRPNLYVILIGPSARVRRTTAVNIGNALFKEAFPDSTIVSQKITPEALISVLTEQYRKTGTSTIYIVSSELGVFLSTGSKDLSLIQLLTKLYDCEESMDYHTLARGKEKCNKVCCNMLGSTTPEWLKDSLPEHAVEGGFTSRVIFVYQNKPERLVAFPTITPEMKELKKRLVEDLREIGSLRGEFKLTEEAREWYETWYLDVFRSESEQKGLSGYYGRKHDTLLKLGMLACVSRRNELVIQEDDLRMALNALSANENMLPQAVKMMELTEEGRDNEKVLRIVRRRGVIGYSDLLRNLSYCMNSKRVNEVIDMLVAGELIEEVIKDGKRFFKPKS